MKRKYRSRDLIESIAVINISEVHFTHENQKFLFMLRSMKYFLHLSNNHVYIHTI